MQSAVFFFLHAMSQQLRANGRVFPTQRLIFSIPSTGKGPPPHHRRQILEMSTPTTFDFFYSDQIWNSRLSLVIHLVKGKFASGRPHPYTKSQWFKKFGDSNSLPTSKQHYQRLSRSRAHLPAATSGFLSQTLGTIFYL